MTAIRNPEAYLYTVASNLAKEHARHERQGGAALDVDDPLVQEQLAELPAFASQLDGEQRIKRLREGTAAAATEMPSRGGCCSTGRDSATKKSPSGSGSRRTWSRST